MSDTLCSPGTPFYSAVSSRVSGNTIVITFCNLGFVDMVLNWLHTVNTVGLKNFLVISLDKSSFDALSIRKVPTFLLQRPDRVFKEESSNFGSVEFISICNEKPWVVNQILKAGFNVLWSDSDIVFLKVLNKILVNAVKCLESVGCFRDRNG